MIHEKLEFLPNYIDKSVDEEIKSFLSLVSKDIPEGRYEIKGEDIFAIVMSYPTKDVEDCIIETHNKYIDIQVSITGGEGISVFPRESLQISSPYAEDKDVTIYYLNSSELVAHINNLEGFFTLLYPHEAHRPQEYLADINVLKKFVIKIRREII